MNKEKFLPLGSVVILKGAKKRIMIIGFVAQSQQTGNKVFDYMGCLYPEGVLNTEQSLLFDHEQIDKIYYIGLSDNEEKDFKEKLVKLVNDTNNVNSNKINDLEKTTEPIVQSIQQPEQPQPNAMFNTLNLDDNNQ